MAESLDGIAERIKKEYSQEAEEIERTVPNCSTCLFELVCIGPYNKMFPWCKEFIPKNWRDHIYFNGEWWS